MSLNFVQFFLQFSREPSFLLISYICTQRDHWAFVLYSHLRMCNNCSARTQPHLERGMQVLNLLPQHCKVLPRKEEMVHYQDHMVKSGKVILGQDCLSILVLTSLSPSGGHVSREVSSIMEQLIVFEEFFCRIVWLHALRTDEALNTKTYHHTNHVTVTSQTALIVHNLHITSDVWSWFRSVLGCSDSVFWEPPFPGVWRGKKHWLIRIILLPVTSSYRRTLLIIIEWLKNNKNY